MSINASSVLVELNISVWMASKVDKTATENVNRINNADQSAARVRKNLMAGTNKRKAIADFATSARLWHNSKTLPWLDRGARLLPISLFIDYKQELDGRRYEFDRMVDEFISVYPSLVQTSHNYLGNMFNPDDYPTADEVYRKFGFKVTFTPVPDSGDFRLDIPSQDLACLKEQYEDSFNSRLADAMKEPWDRLHKTLSGISDRLSEEENEDGSKRRYHESMIDNAVELCGLLTHLNVTGDPKLEAARRDLERVMVGTDIEVIRESAAERADIKTKIDEILKQYEW